MKKRYCFYCQQDVNPIGWGRICFCPHCKRYLTDKGEGFYRVCEYCGANMPVDASCCCKCQRCIDGSFKLPLWMQILQNKNAANIVSVILVILFILVALLILYFSFYALIAFFIVGAIYYLISILFNR